MSRNPSPRHLPRLTRAFLEWMTSPEDRDFVLADLDERAAELADEMGPRHARRWYRGQLWKALPTLMWRRLADLSAGSVSEVAGEARVATRTLRLRPLYTLGFSGTLALGLGSALLVSTIAWGLWLAPLPFPEADLLVRIYEQEDAAPGEEPKGRSSVSPPVFTDLTAALPAALASVAAMTDQSVEIDRGDQRELVDAYRVSPDFFATLGVPPEAGRVSWQPDAPEVVISAALWEREFARDPAVVDRGTLTLNDEVHRIVGVVDMGAGFPRPRDLILPLAFDEGALSEGMRGARYLHVVGRLRGEVGVERAEAELSAFIAGLGEAHPQNQGWSAQVVGLQDDLTAPFRNPLRLLLAAGLVFLSLAGVNIVGLAAARGVERRPEHALRHALGASHQRISRGVTVEGLVLGSLGVGGALLLAYLLLPLLIEGLPLGLPRRERIEWDGRLAGAFVAVGLLLSVVVGWAGHRFSRSTQGSRAGSRTVVAGMGGRRALVVGQISLTTLLLSSTALVTGRMVDLRRTDLGFAPGPVTAMPLILPASAYAQPEARWVFARQVLEGLKDRGVEAAVLTNPPLAGSNMNYGFLPEGATEQAWAQYHVASAHTFSILGIDIESGRDFLAGEEAPVVIINREIAREHFGDVDPVGRSIRLLGTERTIVGVVASTRHFGPDQPPPGEIYVPLRQDPWGFSHLVATGGPDLGRLMQEVVHGIDPSLPESGSAPYAARVSAWFATIRLQLAVVGALGLIGTFLAGLGLYTIIAYHVRSRSREIGIRRALGAPSSGLFRNAIRQATAMGAAGAAVGLAIWWSLSGWVGALLAIDSDGGPWPVFGVATVVLLVSVMASLVPALRSIRIEPTQALRAE